MSDSAAVTVASLGPGSPPVFTAAQWQELEHQALIFKYLKAGLPVPTFLLAPIRKNLQLLSPTLLHHSALSYCSYYGKRMDLEPGRCRRTDGKKWRCSKDAHPDSKYCERHMNRSRNRSRKPVESQTTSCSMSTVASDIARGTSSRSGTFGNLNFPSIGNSEVLCFGSNASQWQMESIPFGINGKDYRNSSSSWSTAEADKQSVSSQTSGNIWNHGISSAVDGTWHPVSQIPPNPFPEPRNSALLLENNPQLQIHQEFELQPRGPAISKQQQQHYVFAKDFGSPGSMKQEYQSLQPPFEEWSHRKDSGSCFDQGSNKNSFPIQLSMAIPVSPKSFARSVHPRSGNALFPSSESFLRPSNQSDSNVG